MSYEGDEGDWMPPRDPREEPFASETPSRPEVTSEVTRFVLEETRTELREMRREARDERRELRDAIARGLQNLSTQFNLHDQKDEERHTETMTLVKGLAARVDKLERSAEDTGSYVVGERQRAATTRKVLGKVALEVLKVLVALAVGGAAAHIIIH